MTLIMGICVAVTFGVSVYMLLGRELKGIAMGVFLLSHAANLSIISMSGSPIYYDPEAGVVMKQPPLLTEPVIEQIHAGAGVSVIVDPLPQALILTAIVIGFAVMGFLLSLIVVTGRSAGTLSVDELAREQIAPPSQDH